MTNDTHILDSIEPEVMDRVAMSRRELFSGIARRGAIVSAPLVLALSANKAFGQELPRQIVDVLNFALTLEYLEAAFYAAGAKSGIIPSRYRSLFLTIGKHEAAHVELLQGVLGSAAVASPTPDFTAGGKYPDVLENFETLLTLAITFEDLGVAAYKGQAPKLMGSNTVLTTALEIHSVEARHASALRRLGGKAGWTGAFDKPKTKAQVLAAASPFIAK
jgi:hypothetical protein